MAFGLLEISQFNHLIHCGWEAKRGLSGSIKALGE